MTGKPTNENPNGGEGFFPGDMPVGLDLIVADPGSARYQMLGYRLCYQQVWPPTTLPHVSLCTAVINAGKSSATQPAAPRTAKNRRGRKRRDGGLTCEEQMLLLAEADLTVMALKPPSIHDRMVERWGEENAFCIRTIQEQPLYKAWQFELAKLRKELKMSPKDFTEEGLAILSHKPGREDKRKVSRAQYEQKTRSFLAAMENTNIKAKRAGEAAQAARDQRNRQ
jgi:hypothetical protein